MEAVASQIIYLETLTFSYLALTGDLSVKLCSVALRNTQQCPHEVRQLLCTQAAFALFVKQLENRRRTKKTQQPVHEFLDKMTWHTL